jgi:hypothetical protein
MAASMSSSKNLTRYQRTPPPGPRPDTWSFIDTALCLVLLGAGIYFGNAIAWWAMRVHHG